MLQPRARLSMFFEWRGRAAFVSDGNHVEQSRKIVRILVCPGSNSCYRSTETCSWSGNHHCSTWCIGKRRPSLSGYCETQFSPDTCCCCSWPACSNKKSNVLQHLLHSSTKNWRFLFQIVIFWSADPIWAKVQKYSMKGLATGQVFKFSIALMEIQLKLNSKLAMQYCNNVQTIDTHSFRQNLANEKKYAKWE